MTRRHFVLLLTALFLAAIPARAEETPNFAGHYELAQAQKASRTFSLDIKQKPKHSGAEISFSAAMNDGSGAAPDGDGKGEVDDGVLAFKFKDSFKNEGTATLTLVKGKYLLSMTVTKAIDPRPLHFYGNMTLARQ